MKLKELKIVGGSVYVNVVRSDVTETETLSSSDAVKKFGEYDVIEHIPYKSEGQATVVSDEPGEKASKKSDKRSAEGTDIVILRG